MGFGDAVFGHADSRESLAKCFESTSTYTERCVLHQTHRAK